MIHYPWNNNENQVTGPHVNHGIGMQRQFAAETTDPS